MLFRTSLAVSAVLFMSACATPPTPLSELKPAYPSVDVAMIDGQDKIHISLGSQEAVAPAYYYVPAGTSPAAAAAGGLFAALIIAGINSVEAADARKDAEPLNDALADWDYAALLRDEIQSVLPALSWTDVGEATVVDGAEPKELAAVVENSDAPGVLAVGASYYLSHNADTVVVSAQALLHPVPEREEGARPLRAAPPAVFSTTVSYEMPSPVSGKRRADHIPAWVADDAEALRAGLTRGASKVAALLMRQLEDGNMALETPEGEKPERRTISAFGQPLRVKVQVLEAGPEGELVRAQGGALRFLAPPYQPEPSEPDSPSGDDAAPDPAPVDDQASPEEAPAGDADAQVM